MSSYWLKSHNVSSRTSALVEPPLDSRSERWHVVERLSAVTLNTSTTGTPPIQSDEFNGTSSAIMEICIMYMNVSERRLKAELPEMCWDDYSEIRAQCRHIKSFLLLITGIRETLFIFSTPEHSADSHIISVYSLQSSSCWVLLQLMKECWVFLTERKRGRRKRKPLRSAGLIG